VNCGLLGEMERKQSANARRPSLTVRRCQNSIGIIRIGSRKAMVRRNWYECNAMSRGSSVRQASGQVARERWRRGR
jgi:hypothetical protein